MDAPIETVPKHHVKQEWCITRPKYRDGRKPKAIKVYTVCQESVYILVHGVPAVGAMQDLVRLCALYGEVVEYRILDEYPDMEEFTETYWIKYRRIQSARTAKRKLDDFSFCGGNLHVHYAPEFESVEDTRQKLQERRKAMAGRIRDLEEEGVLERSSSSSKDEKSYTRKIRMNPQHELMSHSAAPLSSQTITPSSKSHAVALTSVGSRLSSAIQENVGRLLQPQTQARPAIDNPLVSPYDRSTQPVNNSLHSQHSLYGHSSNPHVNMQSQYHHVSSTTTVQYGRQGNQTPMNTRMTAQQGMHAVGFPSSHQRETRHAGNQSTAQNAIDASRSYERESWNMPYETPLGRLSSETDTYLGSSLPNFKQGAGISNNRSEVLHGKPTAGFTNTHTRETESNKVIPHKCTETGNRKLDNSGGTKAEKITPDGLVIRPYKKPHKTAPRFVPRQTTAVAKNVLKKSNAERIAPVDSLHTELKQNAGILGSVKGPTIPQDIKEEIVKDTLLTGDVSLEETANTIRGKLKAISSIHEVTSPAKKMKRC